MDLCLTTATTLSAMSDKLSTSALAKLRNLAPKQLFDQLASAGYINRYQETWVLTDLGAKFGGEYLQHPKFGQFIVWPSQLLIDDGLDTQLLSATQLGERLKLNAKKVNQLLSELGWIHRDEQGWQLTDAGASAGGKQKIDKASHQQFVLWHAAVVKHKRLRQSVTEFLGQDASLHATDKSISSFRHKFEAKHRTLDGHYVRTIGELRIDNWLYMNGIAHAYARQLPIEEDVICDFYLPSGKVYLQYWGEAPPTDNAEQRQQLRELYQRHGFALIEIHKAEIETLDDLLPQRLRAFGIKAY